MMVYIIDQLIPDREGKNFRREKISGGKGTRTTVISPIEMPYKEGYERLKFLVRLGT